MERDIEKSKNYTPAKVLFCNVVLQRMRNNIYEPEVGDLHPLTDVRPKCIDDLNRPKRTYLLSYVQGVDDENPDLLSIHTSKPLVFEEGTQKNKKDIIPAGQNMQKNKEDTFLVVYLVNMTTNILHTEIIELKAGRD